MEDRPDQPTRGSTASRLLARGEPARQFELLHFGPNDPAPHPVRLTDTAGMVRFLNVVDSIHSPAGHAATRQLEQLRGQLPPGAVIYTVTRDVPDSQQRWYADEAILHEVLSTQGNPQFAHDYGLDLDGSGRLQRAILIISRNDRIAHADYAGGPEGEPDFAAAVEALQHIAG